MNFSELKNSLKAGEEKNIYLLEGEDTFFSERALSLIKSNFLSDETFDYALFFGDAPVSEIISSLNMYPFMGQKRVTVIKEFYPKAEGVSQDIKAFFDSPNKESVLIIQNLKQHDFFKKFNSIAFVECNKADTGSIVKWIKGTMAQDGVSIDGESAQLIAEYCKNDMQRIATEVSKLVSYAIKDGRITREDVELLVSKDAEYKIFEITDFIGKKKFDKALTAVSDMLSKGETEQHLLSSLYNYFRRLLHCAISDMTVEELSKVFGVKEYAIKKAKEQANMFKKRSLKNAVDMLSDMDYKIKSGEIDADKKLYIAIFKIMTY